MPRRPERARPPRSNRPGPRRRPAPRDPARGRLAILSAGLIGLALLLWLGLRASRSPAGDPSGLSSARATDTPIRLPADPIDAPGWLLRIDRARVEGRQEDALAIGRRAYGAVPPGDRPEILRAVTLAMLAEVPEAQARASLRRRVEADPTDLDARVALILRSIRPENDPAAGRPRVGLPSSREPGAVVELEEIVETNPGHLGGRAALVDLLLDLGRIDRARSVLDAWPRGDLEDPRRLRLEARLDLDHDARPDRASETLRGLVAASPHDWRLRARLARALEMARDTEAARLEAKSVDRLRERLNPDRLGRRLAEDFRDLDDPSAMLDLAELCASVGLSELAAAWRIEANAVGPAGRAD